jgi:hypothetical protein
MSGSELETLIEGLEVNGLLDYQYLLTGYIGFIFVRFLLTCIRF